MNTQVDLERRSELAWGRVAEALEGALAISWDGCHKIYLAMDQEQASWHREFYKHTVEVRTPTQLGVLQAWFDMSCPLRFISSVRTDLDDPNRGYTTLIAQFELDEEED